MDVITYPRPNFNGSLAKALLTLEYGQVICVGERAPDHHKNLYCNLTE